MNNDVLMILSVAVVFELLGSHQCSNDGLAGTSSDCRLSPHGRKKLFWIRGDQTWESDTGPWI